MFSLLLQLAGERCVVIGGGRVATRRVQSLLAAGADVLVISPAQTNTLQTLMETHRITHVHRPYQVGDLEGAKLVIAATNSADVNRAVQEEATRLGVLCNRADDGKAGDFIVPAVVHVGGVQIAISTFGAAPSVAKDLRLALECDLATESHSFIDVLRTLPLELKRQKNRLPEESVDSRE